MPLERWLLKFYRIIIQHLRTQSDLYNLNRRNQKGKKEGEGQKNSVYTTQAIKNLIFTHGKKFNFFSEQNRNYK